jgi:hypothetical protein
MQAISNMDASYMIVCQLYYEKISNKRASTQREIRDKRLFCEKTF